MRHAQSAQDALGHHREKGQPHRAGAAISGDGSHFGQTKHAATAARPMHASRMSSAMWLWGADCGLRIADCGLKKRAARPASRSTDAAPAQQRTRFAAKKPERENGGQQPHAGSDQAVGVFKKNPAEPFRDRERKTGCSRRCSASPAPTSPPRGWSPVRPSRPARKSPPP